MKHGRTVESFGERFPLLGGKREGRLVCDDLLGASAGAFKDKVGDIDAALPENGSVPDRDPLYGAKLAESGL